MPGGLVEQVSYTSEMTERPRLALRQPRSLQPEQLGDLPVTMATAPTPLAAWVVWEDGVKELVTARDRMDEARGPGQVRSTTPPAFGVGPCSFAHLTATTTPALATCSVVMDGTGFGRVRRLPALGWRRVRRLALT